MLNYDDGPDAEAGSAPTLFTIVATGLTSGVGEETLKQLVARDGAFRVIIGCRTIPTTQQVEHILALRSSPQTSVEYLPLDLALPTSVDSFAEEVRASLQGYSIDALLLCAGILTPTHKNIVLPHSGQQVEETVYVNALSQALITTRLLENLSPTGRISLVNSGRHLNAPRRRLSISNNMNM